MDNLTQIPDSAFGPIIHGFRSNGWVGMKLSCAGAPNGAAVSTNLWTGVNRKGLISNGAELDWVNIMAYDSGLEYQPLDAFKTYRSVYKGPLYLGIELGTQGWGNAITSETNVLEYHESLKHYDAAGFFVWAFHKPPESSPSIERIIEIAERIKPGLACPNCKKELLVVLNLAK